MARKRKLYLSELLKRNYNFNLTIVIAVNKKVFTFYDKESILSLPDIKDRQVKQWSMTHSALTQTLHIVLD